MKIVKNNVIFWSQHHLIDTYSFLRNVIQTYILFNQQDGFAFPFCTCTLLLDRPLKIKLQKSCSISPWTYNFFFVVGYTLGEWTNNNFCPLGSCIIKYVTRTKEEIGELRFFCVITSLTLSNFKINKAEVID